MPVIRHSSRSIRLVLVAIFALGAVGATSGACSLNPQPIPPGADTDAAFAPTEGDDPYDKNSGADASFADATGGGLSDSGTSRDTGTPGDALAVPNLDAGDAADAIADAADGE
jgi:hypothetical protein